MTSVGHTCVRQSLCFLFLLWRPPSLKSSLTISTVIILRPPCESLGTCICSLILVLFPKKFSLSLSPYIWLAINLHYFGNLCCVFKELLHWPLTSRAGVEKMSIVQYAVLFRDLETFEILVFNFGKFRVVYFLCMALHELCLEGTFTALSYSTVPWENYTEFFLRYWPSFCCLPVFLNWLVASCLCPCFWTCCCPGVFFPPGVSACLQGANFASLNVTILLPKFLFSSHFKFPKALFEIIHRL